MSYGSVPKHRKAIRGTSESLGEGLADRSPGEERPRELRGKLSRGRIYRGSAWKTRWGKSPGEDRK